MSSLTNAFAQLNNSIRGIRSDRERHEERMMALDFAKSQDEYQRNDPRIQYERAKSAAQMQIGKFDTGLSGRNMTPKDHEHFNKYIKPAISDVIPQDTELNGNNQLVWAGTNEIVELPKWKRDALRADIDIAMATATIGNNKLDMELDNLADEISTMEKRFELEGTAKKKITGPLLRTKKATLAALQKEATSPMGRFKRLLSTNMELSKIHKAAMMHPNISEEVFRRFEGLRTVNNQELKTLALLLPKEDANKYATVYYSRIDPNTGAKTEREVIMPKLVANNAPAERAYPDGVFKLGKISNLSKPDSGGSGQRNADGTWDFTEANKNLINKDITKAKMILGVAMADLKGETAVKELLKGQISGDESKFLMGMLETGKDTVVKAQIDLLKKYARYGGASWLVDFPEGIDTNTKPVEAETNPKDILGWRKN